MSNVVSLADIKAQKDKAVVDAQALTQQVDMIEQELVMQASMFLTDNNGKCSTLSVDGFHYYAAKYAKYAVYLTGQETFRDLQRLKQAVLQPYEDKLDTLTQEAIRTGKVSGSANMAIALASLDGDMEGVMRGISSLADTLQAAQPDPTGTDIKPD